MSEAQAGRLTKRETECLAWVAQGKTVRDTADILDISYNTARGYAKSACKKLGCNTLAHAVGVLAHDRTGTD